MVGTAEFVANGVTFRPVALESLSHFPVTVAAHRSTGELTLLVEVLDGALGTMAPESLGRRVLAVLQRLVSRWDRWRCATSTFCWTASTIRPHPACRM